MKETDMQEDDKRTPEQEAILAEVREQERHEEAIRRQVEHSQWLREWVERCDP
jgi:hypothetical protein